MKCSHLTAVAPLSNETAEPACFRKKLEAGETVGLWCWYCAKVHVTLEQQLLG